jgi:SAM-dependent methyltransferase
VDVLLDVIERLSRPGKEPIRLILTGPGWEHAIEAEMPDVAVEYFPFLPRERMPDFYAALDVYVSTARVEGGPVPVLEAMSCATPVVSTRIGTVRDLVTNGEQALLVATDDADATVEAIESLRADPVRAKRIGEAARARILESVGSLDVVRRAREIYEPLISSSNRAQPRRLTPEELTRVNRELAASDSRRWHAGAGSEHAGGAIRGLVRRLRNAWTDSRNGRSRGRRPEGPDEVAHIDLDELRVSKDSRILDLGCGTGQFSLPLLEREHRVVSVDFDAPRLREVRAACVESELEGQLARADAACLPCPTRSFDAVVCREMIEHIAEPGPVLDEIHRVLRPEGWLCVTVPSAHTERFFQRVDPRWLDMAGHVHVFSRAAMCELLTAHGFEVTEIRGRNFFYSLFWFFHTLVRTTHDGTGRIQDHFGLAQRIFRAWRMLGEGRVKRGVERAGNALFPKSNVYYCVKARVK